MRFFGYCKSYGAVRCCDVSYGWLIAREKTKVVVLSHVSLARDILSRRWSLRNRMDFFFGRAGFVFVLLDCCFLFFLGGGVTVGVVHLLRVFYRFFFCFSFVSFFFSPLPFLLEGSSFVGRGKLESVSRFTSWKGAAVLFFVFFCSVSQ